MNAGELRVVIADDEPDVRLLLRIQLAGAPGMSVVGEAGDGVELVEQCRELKPDAVVIDLQMPKMAGIEAIEILQRENPSLGVLAYTATAGDYVQEEMERLGVTVMLKTGDLSRLAETVRETVARKS